MSRLWPVPPGGRTIHLVGDLHAGSISTARKNIVIADMGSEMMASPAFRVQVGDSVDFGGQSGEDAAALAFLNSLGSEPTYTILGNHDIYPAGLSGTGRSAATWSAVWGYSSKNYTVDFGFCLAVMIGPDTVDADGATAFLSQATLDWLETTLATAQKPCLVFCHWPLYNTVVGGTTLYWDSTEAAFHITGPNETDDTEIRSVLGEQENAKAWICGHTHSPLTQPGFTTTVTVGDRTIPHINCSALYYTGRTVEALDPLVTLFLTVYDGHFELRYRDHGAGVWTHDANGDRVTTLDVP